VLRGRRLDGETLSAALEEIGREVTPIDDVRSTARYRARVARNLLAEFLSDLSGGVSYE
jgi:xanthine dehydrogenase iron-sulfur cluster and FAD-binding subunit A